MDIENLDRNSLNKLQDGAWNVYDVARTAFSIVTTPKDGDPSSRKYAAARDELGNKQPALGIESIGKTAWKIAKNKPIDNQELAEFRTGVVNAARGYISSDGENHTIPRNWRLSCAEFVSSNYGILGITEPSAKQILADAIGHNKSQRIVEQQEFKNKAAAAVAEGSRLGLKFKRGGISPN